MKGSFSKTRQKPKKLIDINLKILNILSIMIRKPKVGFIEPLLVSAMVIERQIDSVIKNHTDYGLSQIKILIAIEKMTLFKKQELAIQSTMAHLWGVSEAAISRQVTVLEEGGLIRRKTDPDERRKIMMRLTPKGKRLAHKISGIMDKELTRLFKPISESGKKQLDYQLKKVLQALSTNTRHYDITEINTK